MNYLGDFAIGSTIYVYFSTNSGAGGAVAPSDAFENSDVRIYKDGSATQRASVSGVTMTSPFDSVIGLHLLAIDLSDNDDPGFYAAGSHYTVVLAPDETVDGEAVVAVIARFSILGTTALRPTTPGRTLGVESDGHAHADVKEVEGTDATDALAAQAQTGSAAALVAYDPPTKAELDAAAALLATGADMATVLARLTAARAGYLDNLNVGGPVASSAEVTAVQNNTRCVRVVPAAIERPDAGSITIPIEFLLYDSAGNMEAPDAAPTLGVFASDGTDLSARLDSTTMALVSTGRYRAVLTVDVGDDLDCVRFVFSVIEGGAARVFVNTAWIVDTTAVDFTSADRSDLQAAKAAALGAREDTENLQTRIPAALTAAGLMQSDAVRVGATVQTGGDLAALLATIAAYIDTEIAAIKAKTDNLPAAPAATADVTSAQAAILAKLPAALVGGRMDCSVGDVVAAALAQFFTRNSGSTFGAAVAGSVVKEIVDNVEGGGGGGGMELTDAVPANPAAGSVGEALAATLHGRIGKRVLTDNGDGSYTLRTYRAHSEEFTDETLWLEEVLNHPTAPSEVVPQ